MQKKAIKEKQRNTKDIRHIDTNKRQMSEENPSMLIVI